MSEELRTAIEVLAAILVSLFGGRAIVSGRKQEQNRIDIIKRLQILADHNEKRYNEANEDRLKQAAQIDELEIIVQKQNASLTEITARLTILNDERAKERLTYQGERDEYMKGQGRLEVQFELMKAELHDLKTQFEAVQSENHELRNYRELAREQTHKITELESKNRELNAQVQVLKDQIRILESRLNPQPDPPRVVDPKKASGE